MLIAFIIAAIALSVMFAGSLDGLIAVQAATGYEQAIARARSHLAAERVTLVPGDREGDDGGGFRWHAHVHPIETYRPKPQETGPAATPGAPTDAPPTIVTLYAIDVGISWSAAGRTREVDLPTEQLGAALHTIR